MIGWLTRLRDGLLAGAALLAAGLVAWFLRRARTAEREAALQTQRADQAEAAQAGQARIVQAQADTERRHRNEQRESDARLAAGQRDHLEDHW